ncbi:MAG: hypothetical protein ACE5M4_15165, partial [Anaerolineales bacterium]
ETPSGNVSVKLVWELSVIEQAAILASALGFLFVGALLLDGTLLGGNGFTWLKIAIALRIPSPFLGKGASQEWVERKRAELEAGTVNPEPKILKPEEAIPWIRPDKSDSRQKQRVPSPATEAKSGRSAIEAPIGADGETLLASWLESTGHDEDEWAERLLEKREHNPSEEA